MKHELSIPYVGIRNPGTIDTGDFLQPSEIARGTNCQLYVAAVTRSLGRYMPPYYRSSEIFQDPENLLEDIDPRTTLVENGDIVGLWFDTQQDPKKIHVGILQINNRQLFLLHSSKEEGKVVCSPLTAVMHKYKGLACIKRPNVLIPAFYNPDALKKLGYFT